MPDLPGAKKAIRDKFTNDWAARTPVQIQNTDPPDAVWPPADVPWVYLEIIDTSADLRGAGTIGDHIWLYTGTVFIHINVPINYGIEDVEALAWQAGEILKAQTLYSFPSLGAKVICGAAEIAGGSSDADKGKWFTLTTAVPFEYYHRG